MGTLRTGRKALTIRVDAPNVSADGGLLLLRKLDARLGLTERMASCLSDPRVGVCRHSFSKMLAQRVYGIAMGWEDCNDFDALASDPLYALVLGSRPASQPTLSRFERSVDAKGLYRMSRELVELFVERFRKERPNVLVLDIDATVDPAHGQQEFDFYNGFYRCHCYLPLLVFASFDGSAREILAAVLRPGNAQSGTRAAAILRRLAGRLREAFPETKILVRADAGFAWPEFYAACEELGLKYLVAAESCPKLRAAAEPFLAEAREERDRTRESARRYGETDYRAYSWKASRRVVFKAEALARPGKAGKDNARFLVTNLRQAPQALYEIYGGRGESENRIKELKLDLVSGRTSCTEFLANAFRLMLHALAYYLLGRVRESLTGTELERATLGRIRREALKIAAVVEESTRRFLVRLPRGHPRARWLARTVEA